MLAAYRGVAVRRFSVKRAPGGDGWAVTVSAKYAF
jgi:hypothetical protein